MKEHFAGEPAPTPGHFGWDASGIGKECEGPCRDYLAGLRARWIDYHDRHPELGRSGPYSAASLGEALPPGHGRALARLVPPERRHRHATSARSSQALLLGLLGPPRGRDEAGKEIARALGLASTPLTRSVEFEYQLAPDVLGEASRTTSVDLLIETDTELACIEAKYTEEGFGRCSCARERGDPARGRCSPRVLARTAYLETLTTDFVLAAPEEGGPCPLSTLYQAVRTVAAAKALAGPGRRAAAGLIYDERNPYFCGAGRWPGWARVLDERLSGSPVRLVLSSCQALIGRLGLDRATLAWATEKHDLSSRSA